MRRPDAPGRRVPSGRSVPLALLVTLAAGLPLAACGGDDRDPAAARTSSAMPPAVTPSGEPPTAHDDSEPPVEQEPTSVRTAATSEAPAATPSPRAPLQRAADAAVRAGGSGTGAAVGTIGPGVVVRAGRAATHAWSSAKVPVLAAVLRARRAGQLSGGRTPTADERRLATRALTVSDNAAALALFAELERRFGGVDGASAQVEEALRAGSGRAIAVNRRRRGSFTTFGQTTLRLTDGVRFYGGLAGSCVLSTEDTRFVLGLMRQVSGDQRWGLGTPAWGATIGFKGGWGPEAGGRYVAVQYGVLRRGSRGVAVAVAADARGGLEAVTPKLTAMARAMQRALPPSRWPLLPKTCPDA
ncbi:hypothetical protein [Patulibacter defluvii]|uniref:hypothetical protein n=1 Tax=Patulibacter defluvii TaxID=3095358 RepID=UPI002A75BF76|nr:hypothetical protein [Patulibacter sp. DM4]